MEYNLKLLNFLELNVSSHEFQFLSATEVSKAIIDFNLFLNRNVDCVNYGNVLAAVVPVKVLLRNSKFIKWAYLTIGMRELALDHAKFNSILKNEKEIASQLIRYFDLQKQPRLFKGHVISSILAIPYSGVELDSCDKINLVLHDFQTRVKDRVAHSLLHNKNERVLIHMPTGSGKTRTAVEFMVDHIRTNSSSLYSNNIYLWFTNSVELSQQAFDSFIEIWKFKGDRPVGVHKFYENASVDALYEKVVLENVSIVFVGFQKFNSLFGSSKFRESIFLQLIRENNVLSIVDEAHISLAETYDRAIEYVSSFNRSKLIGLTATPGRNSLVTGDLSNQLLAAKFLGNIVQISFSDESERSPIEVLQERGFLANVSVHEIENSSSLANDIPLEYLAYDLDRNRKILEVIMSRAESGKSILVFSASTDHSVILKTCLKALDIDSEIVDANSEVALRKTAIANFKSGKLKVLINFGVLSTGFDAPILNCLIIARPISSIVLYSQIVGRALRGPNNGGNKENEIFIVKDKMVNYLNPSFLYSYWSSFWN